MESRSNRNWGEKGTNTGAEDDDPYFIVGEDRIRSVVHLVLWVDMAGVVFLRLIRILILIGRSLLRISSGVFTLGVRVCAWLWFWF